MPAVAADGDDQRYGVYIYDAATRFIYIVA